MLNVLLMVLQNMSTPMDCIVDRFVVYCCITTKMNDSFTWYYKIGVINISVWS